MAAPGRRPRVERRGCPPERSELPPEPLDLRGVEAGADFRDVDEPRAVVEAEVKRAEARAGPLRVGEPAHHELLPAVTLDLEPCVRAARHVRARAALGHDTLEPRLCGGLEERSAARAVHVLAEAGDSAPGEHELQARLPRLERQVSEIVALEREAIEEHGPDGDRRHCAGDVVGAGEAHPRLQPLEARHAAWAERHDLAVQQEPVERERAEGGDDLRIAAGHDLAAPAEEGHVVAPPLGEHAHAVVLDLE
jgi:hypothetical protein